MSHTLVLRYIRLKIISPRTRILLDLNNLTNKLKVRLFLEEINPHERS